MFSWLFSFRLWLLPSLYLVCCSFFAFLSFCETSVCCFLIVAVVNKRQGFPSLQCCLVPFCGSFNLHGNVGMCALQKVTMNVTVLSDGHCIQRLVRRPSLSPASVLGRPIRCVMGLLIFASRNRTSCALGSMVNGFQAHRI